MQDDATRIVEDALGALTVPRDAYYGAQTERGRQNNDVSGQVIGDFPGYVNAIVEVKKACALANLDIGVLRQPVADAICQAADEILSGRFGRPHFPVDIMNAGGGVSPNMNVNELLANRANEILTGSKGYGLVHPNNHVNTGQSTSDVLETAMSIALHRDILGLLASVRLLEDVIEEKIEQYPDAVKLSRTCVQDAVPVTFGQQFGAYLAVARRGITRLEDAADACLDVTMGGTVVGTGLGVGAGYVERIYPRLREVTGLELRRHPNFFDAFQNGDVFQHISTTFKALATNLGKMSKDLRLLASGPRMGMSEIQLPAVQAGSSFLTRQGQPGHAGADGPDRLSGLRQRHGRDDGGRGRRARLQRLDGRHREEPLRVLPAAHERDPAVRREVPARDGGAHGPLPRERREHARAVVDRRDGVRLRRGCQGPYYAANHGTSIREAAVALGIMSREAAGRLLDPLILTDAQRSPALVDAMLADERERVAAVIAGIGPDVRQAIFDVARAVARADGDVSSQERQVLDVVASALQIDADASATEVDGLGLDVDGLDEAEPPPHLRMRRMARELRRRPR